MPGHAPQRTGFTLIEILITVVVLSTGLVLVLQGLHSVLHIWDEGVQRTRAFMTAQEEFSRLRHEAQLGLIPQSGRDFQVEPGVSGHTGLYRVRYSSAHMESRGLAAYEILLYVAPEVEDTL